MELNLYKYDGCPYCERVMRAIRESGRTDEILIFMKAKRIYAI